MTTTTNDYQIYTDSCIALASTIVIKSEATANALNTYVGDYFPQFPVDTLAPDTWKYYMNVAGQYHPTDTIMMIVSLDTLESIEFTAANLVFHTATAKAYEYGTRQYQELVSQYPTQEMLILGILYPCDINTAINAKDFTILSYPPSLIEENEYSLIKKLQRWVTGYNERWVIDQFAISDSLYPATVLGIMYLMLVPTIVNFRLEACKTNEAHSFHVKQYLASHGGLDIYWDQMTLKQSLFLYRNVAYIERNVGKQDTFAWLVEHIMTERNLPLAEYLMRHDLSQQPTELYPTIMFDRVSINGISEADSVNSISLDVMLTKEDPLATDNLLYHPDYEPVIQEVMENSLSNSLMTKVLESSIIDYTDSTLYSFANTLMNHWIFLSTNGLYVAYTQYVDPVTAAENSLSVADAFVFAWYVYCASIGVQLLSEPIPDAFAERVQRLVGNSPIGVDDIMSVVDPLLVDESIAVQALSMQPAINTIVSTEAFYLLCQEIYNAEQMQRNLIAYQEDSIVRGMVENMVSRIYSDNICTLSPTNQTYAQWFAARNIVPTNWSQENLINIYADLVNNATGVALNPTSSLSALQTAMVGIMTQLSSYSVQYITEINSSDLIQSDRTAIRASNVEESSGFQEYVNGLVSYPSNVENTISGNIYDDVSVVELKDNGLLSYSTDLGKQTVNIYPSFSPIGEILKYRVNLSPIQPMYNQPLPTNTEGIIPVIGIDTFFTLTPQQQASLRDVYSGNNQLSPPPQPYSTPGYDVDGYTDLE